MNVVGYCQKVFQIKKRFIVGYKTRFNIIVVIRRYLKRNTSLLEGLQLYMVNDKYMTKIMHISKLSV